MARVEIPFIVITSAGAPVVGANAQVNVRAGGAPATVFAAETGPSTLTNPLVTDALGRIEGWVDENSYSIVVSGGSITTYTQQFEAVRGDGVSRYAAGTVDATALGSNAVTTIKLIDGSVTTAKLADLGVTTAKIAANAVDYTKLAATVQSEYIDIMQLTTRFSGLATNVYSVPVTGGGTPRASDAGGDTSTPWYMYAFYLDGGDYAISGRTAKYRLRVYLSGNNTSAGVTFTFGLHQMARLNVGTLNSISFPAITGSTVVFTTPTGPADLVSVSGDFTAPGAPFTFGAYGIGMQISGGTMAGGNLTQAFVQLQRRTV